MNNTFFKQRVLHITAMISTVLAFSMNAVSQGAKPNIEEKIMFRGMSAIVIGGSEQQWTISKLGSVSQESAPLYIALPLSNRILFTINSSAATAKYLSAKIQSVADTRLSFSYVLPGDKLWLAGGVNIPTGKTKLDTSQIKVATLLGQPTFGYKVPSFGQGWNGNFGITYAAPLTRRFILGIGITAFYKAKYEPINNPSLAYSYDPGDEISGNIGADYITLSKVWRVSLDVNGTYFLHDKLNGEKIFQSGPRVIGFMVVSTKTGSLNHTFQMRTRVRGKNSYFEQGVAKTYKSAIQFEGVYSISTPVKEWLAGTLSGEFKKYTEDQIPIGGVPVNIGSAQIVSFGTDLTFLFSQYIIPTITVKYGSGNLNMYDTTKREPVTYSISGFEISTTARISF